MTKAQLQIDLGLFDIELLLEEIKARQLQYPNSKDDRAICKFLQEETTKNLSILEVETLNYAKEHINELTIEDLRTIVEQKHAVL